MAALLAIVMLCNQPGLAQTAPAASQAAAGGHPSLFIKPADLPALGQG